MAFKIFELDGIGPVRVTKRSTSRSIRLSISSKGEVLISIPRWTPYQSGLDFARSRSDWIAHNLPDKTPPLADGDRIGKAHRLVFTAGAVDTPSARLDGTGIRVTRPAGMAASHPEVQKTAQRACLRALRAEAEALLPQRLRVLAGQYGFAYAGVSIRQLKGRWGSCDNKQHIVLNLFLMQLPWHLIDYVLVHELVHTRHLHHGDDFWREFTRHEPRAKALRSLVKAYQPVLKVVPLPGNPDLDG